MSAEPRPTRGQALALDLSRNLAVTAGAGTGKTWVLTRRFIDLLERGPEGLSPQQILAVTFTRKAANEMRSRIAEGIGKRIRRARDAGDTAAYERWTLHRRALAGATITTIHGLGAEIVRRYALEAGIDPEHGILEGTGQDELVQTSVHEALLAAASDTRRTLAGILAHRHRSTIEKILVHLVRDRTFAARWLATLDAHDDAALFDRLMRAVVPFDEAQLAEATTQIGTWSDRLRPMASAEANDKRTSFLARIDACRRCTTPLEHAQALHALWLHVTKEDGAYYNAAHYAVGKKSAWTDSGERAVDALENVIDALRALTGDDPFPRPPGAADLAMLEENRALASVYRDAYERYNAAKDLRGLLDFADLQEKAVDLLQRDWVARDLRSRFRYLLVDEFQDTDPIQWALVRALARHDPLDQALPTAGDSGAFRSAAELEALPTIREVHVEPEHDILDEDRLFLVGDDKQSIYAFRGADVTVYMQSREAVVEANTHHGAKHRRPKLPDDAGDVRHDHDHETLGQVSLDSNFRSLPALVTFANHFFDVLLQPENGAHAPHEARPNPLRHTRDGLTGSIRVIATPRKPRAGDDEEPTDPDAWQRVAASIVADVDGPQALTVQDPRGGALRPASYDDIVVLLARRKPIPDLVRALRALGVPHTVSGGRGFWDTQEVWDLVNLVAVLADGTRDLELAGLLRSPLFAWSDEALARLALLDGHTLAGRLRHAADTDTDLGTPWSPREVHNRLDAWRKRLGRDPLAALVQDILDETAYAASLGADERHRQAVHNVAKLLDVLRSLESRHGSNPARIVRELERIIDSDLDEGEAPVPLATGAGVRILTVHAAKGLEFPVVYVPELERRFQYGHFPDGYRGGTLDGLTLIAARTPDTDGEPEAGALVDALTARDAALGRAELKRLLYVAVTRARDHLVLHGSTERLDTETKRPTPPPLEKATSWMDWLEQILGLHAQAYADAATLDFHGIPITVQTRATGGRPAHAAATEPVALGALVPPPHVPAELVTITPSGAAIYAQCPRRFYHRHVEGLPEARATTVRRREDDHATLIGDLVHTALETGATPDDPIPAAVRRRAHRRAQRLGRDADALLRDVTRHVRNALESLSDDIVLTEVPLDRLVGTGVRVSGRIDRLARQQRGWTVIDTKTDSVRDAAQHAHAHGHDIQIAAYLSADPASLHDGSVVYTDKAQAVAVRDASSFRAILARVEAARHEPGAAEDQFPPRPDKNTCGGCGFWERRGGPCSGAT